jgi:MFS-type transporter involved in bile tolerance (Atg22 family)
MHVVVRGDQEGLFKLVTLDRILNRITGVTSGCWWLVVVNAIPISDICQINQQNISSCSVINNRIKKISQLYCQLKQSFLITWYFQYRLLTAKFKFLG